jgi:hypothetical protein
MPTVEWDIPFEIQSPTAGDLTLNGPDTGQRYLLNAKRCVARRRIRAETTPIPQGDGEIFHDRYANGIEMQLAVQLWDGTEIACDQALCEMRDELYGIVWSLLRPGGPVFTQSGGRVVWTPSCPTGNRMLDAVRLLSIDDPGEDSETGATEITFVLDSPFPYAVSETQTVENLNGLAGSVTNNGNVEFWPVIKVYTDGVTIVNNTTEFEINLYSGCLGGGSYIEIETFRNTMYVDGDQANAKPCLDPTLTDFFPIVPGVNQIDTTGSCDFLLNDAFA